MRNEGGGFAANIYGAMPEGRRIEVRCLIFDVSQSLGLIPNLQLLIPAFKLFFSFILFIRNRVKTQTSTIVFYGERKILPGAQSPSTLLRAHTYRKGERRRQTADLISLLPPESVLAAGKCKQYRYIKTQQEKKDRMQDSPPRQTLERSLIA